MLLPSTGQVLSLPIDLRKPHQRNIELLNELPDRLIGQPAVLIKPLRGIVDITSGCFTTETQLARYPSVSIIALDLRVVAQSLGAALCAIEQTASEAVA